MTGSTRQAAARAHAPGAALGAVGDLDAHHVQVLADGVAAGEVLRLPGRRALREKAAARRGIDGAEVEARIAERAEARKAKDFARGDAIRDALLARGVAILDGPEGTTWDVE